MAEENQTGTAPSAPPTEPSSVTQAEPQTPPEQTPQPPAPAGGGGGMEELSAKIEELERLTQEAQDRASRAEHEARLAYNLREQFGQQRGRTQEDVPDAPSVTDDEFLTNPAKATAKVYEFFREKDRKERERERVVNYVETARTAYERGKQDALKANPALYRGIEADISREVLSNVQSSLQAGQPVDAGVLGNPRYWEAAALAMRVMNGEDVSKYYQRGHSPVAPGHTETPSAGGPPKDVVSLSEEERYTARAWGITDEQYLEQKKRSTEEKARLAR